MPVNRERGSAIEQSYDSNDKEARSMHRQVTDAGQVMEIVPLPGPPRLLCSALHCPSSSPAKEALSYTTREEEGDKV